MSRSLASRSSWSGPERSANPVAVRRPPASVAVSPSESNRVRPANRSGPSRVTGPRSRTFSVCCSKRVLDCRRFERAAERHREGQRTGHEVPGLGRHGDAGVVQPGHRRRDVARCQGRGALQRRARHDAVAGTGEAALEVEGHVSRTETALRHRRGTSGRASSRGAAGRVPRARAVGPRRAARPRRASTHGGPRARRPAWPTRRCVRWRAPASRPREAAPPGPRHSR